MVEETKNRAWSVVAGAFVGIACGASVLVPVTFGYLVTPLARELGWERTQFASAITVYMLVMLVALPFAGKVIDRLGAQRVASASLLAMAVVFAAMALLVRDLRSLHIGYGILALAAVGASPLSYARAVITWFDRQRGMALGIALCGIGLGTALLPSFVRACMQAGGGWQAGFYGVAALLAFVAAPLVWFTVRERRQPEAAQAQGNHGGYLALMRERRFWQMAISFILLGLGISGIPPILPALLEGQGAASDVSAKIHLCLGVSSILGRLLGGWLMDRIYAPWVSVAASLAAILALLLLPSVVAWGLVAAIVGFALGMATGMESDVIAYLSSRYFPAAIFSSVLAAMMAAFYCGAAIGPMVLAYGERMAGNTVFVFIAALLAVASVMQLTLGRYANPTRTA